MPKIMAEYLCTGRPCSVKQDTGPWRLLCAQNEAWIKMPQNSDVVGLSRKILLDCKALFLFHPVIFFKRLGA